MIYDFDSYIKQPLPFGEILGKYFKESDDIIVFDIGSCEGEDSIRLKKKFSHATIYSFEPLPANVRKIKENFKRFDLPVDNIFQIALSNKDGSAEFYVSSGRPKHIPKSEVADDWDFGNKSSSLLPPKEHKKKLEWIKFNKKIKVKTKRLDEFCMEKGIHFIDFIYLDVQGAELMVLEGAGDMLNKTAAIWLEVEAVELYKNQPLKKEVETFMNNHGFIKLMDTVDDVSGDQLYFNSSLIGRYKRRVTKLHRVVRSQILKGVKRTTPISIGGELDMHIPKDMIWAFDNGMYYERNVLFWLEKIAGELKEPVFYDIGANYGYYSLKLADYCSRVYAFEPVYKTYKILRRNIAGNGLSNVKAYRLALSDQSKDGVINLYNSSGNNSTHKRQLPPDHPTKFIGTEKIRCETLQNFIKKEGAFGPTLMKVDIEGGELQFLKGALAAIRKYQPIIIVEYSINTSFDAGYKREEILDLLKKENYQIRGLAESPDNMELYKESAFAKQTIDNLIAFPKSFKLESKW